MKAIPSWGVTSLQNVVHASLMPCYAQQYVAEIMSAASIQLQVVNMYEWVCGCQSEKLKFKEGIFCPLVSPFGVIYGIIELNPFYVTFPNNNSELIQEFVHSFFFFFDVAFWLT